MMMKITNLLLRRLYQSDLEVDLDLRLDETVANAVQIQINVKPKYFNDFAIFYGTKDKVINFSSIFEVKDKNDSYALELFNKDKGIYNYYILDDEDERIHLNTEIELKYLDDKLIEDIIKYLSEEHELTNYLNCISE